MTNREADIAEEEAIKAKASPVKLETELAPTSAAEDEGIVGGVISSFRNMFAPPAAPAVVPETITEEEETAPAPEATEIFAEAAAPTAAPAVAKAVVAEEGAAAPVDAPAKAVIADAPATGETADTLGELPEVAAADAAVPAKRRPSVAQQVAGSVVKAPVKGIRKVSKFFAEGLDSVIQEWDEATSAPIKVKK